MLARLIPRRLGEGEEAELVDHLGELRHRLFVALGAFVPAFALAFAFHGRLVAALRAPLPDGRRLVTLGVTEPFTVSVKVSVVAALALVLPVLLWQAWAFVAPAVDRATRRAIGALVALGTTLFAAGSLFAYVVVLPRALDFLTTFDTHLYDVQLRASSYFGFVAMGLFACGVAFELPVLVLGLVRLGVVSSRQLRRNRRVGYVAILTFAIVLPTVDPVSLALEVTPLLALYETSIWLAALMERRAAAAPRALAEGV